jgi:hypothetical protein
MTAKDVYAATEIPDRMRDVVKRMYYEVLKPYYAAVPPTEVSKTSPETPASLNALQAACAVIDVKPWAEYYAENFRAWILIIHLQEFVDSVDVNQVADLAERKLEAALDVDRLVLEAIGDLVLEDRFTVETTLDDLFFHLRTIEAKRTPFQTALFNHLGLIRLRGGNAHNGESLAFVISEAVRNYRSVHNKRLVDLAATVYDAILKWEMADRSRPEFLEMQLIDRMHSSPEDRYSIFTQIVSSQNEHLKATGVGDYIVFIFQRVYAMAVAGYEEARSARATEAEPFPWETMEARHVTLYQFVLRYFGSTKSHVAYLVDTNRLGTQEVYTNDRLVSEARKVMALFEAQAVKSLSLDEVAREAATRKWAKTTKKVIREVKKFSEPFVVGFNEMTIRLLESYDRQFPSLARLRETSTFADDNTVVEAISAALTETKNSIEENNPFWSAVFNDEIKLHASLYHPTDADRARFEIEVLPQLERSHQAAVAEHDRAQNLYFLRSYNLSPPDSRLFRPGSNRRFAPGSKEVEEIPDSLAAEIDEFENNVYEEHGSCVFNYLKYVLLPHVFLVPLGEAAATLKNSLLLRSVKFSDLAAADCRFYLPDLWSVVRTDYNKTVDLSELIMRVLSNEIDLFIDSFVTILDPTARIYSKTVADFVDVPKELAKLRGAEDTDDRLVICRSAIGKFTCHKVGDVVRQVAFRSMINPVTNEPYPPEFLEKIAQRYSKEIAEASPPRDEELFGWFEPSSAETASEEEQTDVEDLPRRSSREDEDVPTEEPKSPIEFLATEEQITPGNTWDDKMDRLLRIRGTEPSSPQIAGYLPPGGSATEMARYPLPPKSPRLIRRTEPTSPPGVVRGTSSARLNWADEMDRHDREGSPAEGRKVEGGRAPSDESSEGSGRSSPEIEVSTLLTSEALEIPAEMTLELPTKTSVAAKVANVTFARRKKNKKGKKGKGW